MNIFSRHKLRKKQLVIAVGVPCELKTFQEIQKKNSDFLKSLQNNYTVNDFFNMWVQYQETANELSSLLSFLKKKGAKIIFPNTKEQISELFDYENVIIFSHLSKNIYAFEFMGEYIGIEDFIHAIPHDYAGTIDLSSCYSTSFQLNIKTHSPSATIIAVGGLTSIRLRCTIIKQTIKLLLANRNMAYMESLAIIVRRIYKAKGENVDKRNDAYLGCNDSFYPIDNSAIHNAESHFVNTCVYAPSEVNKNDWMLVQVFVYSDNERELVKQKAIKVDEDTSLRQYSPIDFPLKSGDKVTVLFDIEGKEDSGFKIETVWKDHFLSFQFPFYVPINYQPLSIIGKVTIIVNNFPMGRMLFKTRVVTSLPSNALAENINKPLKKFFVSYSHKDGDTVRTLVEGLRIAQADYFYDRHTLQGGDIFHSIIEKWIESSDVFVLCWSKNAEESEEVKKEIEIALRVVERENSILHIYPLSIKPETRLPINMKDVYNFAVLKP